MFTVISDSSPLIGLSMIDLLDILRDLWGQIIIPDAVYKEVVVEGAGKAGADIVAKACNDWIKVVPVTNKNKVEVLQAVLDEGESEVIVLGQELTDVIPPPCHSALDAESEVWIPAFAPCNILTKKLNLGVLHGARQTGAYYPSAISRSYRAGGVNLGMIA